MSVNVLVQDGVVKSLALRYATDGKAELRFTLVQTEKDWPLYLPCTAGGATAERLASEIEDGQHIVITSGRLCYRKRTTKAGEQSRLEILCWSVEVLADSPGAETSPPPVDDSASVEPASRSEAARRPRKRPYPKAALQGGFRN